MHCADFFLKEDLLIMITPLSQFQCHYGQENSLKDLPGNVTRINLTWSTIARRMNGSESMLKSGSYEQCWKFVRVWEVEFCRFLLTQSVSLPPILDGIASHGNSHLPLILLEKFVIALFHLLPNRFSQNYMQNRKLIIFLGRNSQITKRKAFSLFLWAKRKSSRMRLMHQCILVDGLGVVLGVGKSGEMREVEKAPGEEGKIM